MNLILRGLPIGIVVTTLAAAQAKLPSPVKAQTNFEGIDLGSISALGPKVHIHLASKDCKGQPDDVFSKTNGVYYACLDGKLVCSQEKDVTIPSGLIAEFDATLAEHRARMDAYKQRSVREGRSSGDPEVDRQNSLTRHEAVVTEGRKARADGRRPNLVSSRNSSSKVAPSTIPDPYISVAAAPEQPARKVADELLKDVTIGTGRDDVIRKLGEPYSKITGDFERYTYLLVSGSAAKLDIEGGLVRQVRIVPGQ